MPLSLTPVPIPIDLDADSVGCLFAHPEVTATQERPFKLTDSTRGRMATIFMNSLHAAFEQVQGLQRIGFVVAPEFALPFESLNSAESILKSPECAPNTVVIAGLEWITAEQYIALLDGSDNPKALKEKRPDANLFVNCCIVWVKAFDGRLLRYIQPKLHPSPPEAATQVMYRGEDVLVFITRRPNVLSFSLLICFDCIDRQGELGTFDQLLAAVPETDLNTSFNLHILFVPQHNNAPEEPSFFAFVEKFLNSGGTVLNTADSAVAFVNSASGLHGRAENGYGRSSIFYRRGRWQTFGSDGPLLQIPATYAVEDLGRGLMRARFREDGSCLHRFQLIFPWRVSRDVGSSRQPLTQARVRKIGTDGSLGQWESVPALTKVFTDWLADAPDAKDFRFRGKIDSAVEYGSVANNLREVANIEADRIGEIVDLLLLGFDGPNTRPKLNPDTWQRPFSPWRNEEHGQAIVELTAVSSLLSLLDTVDFRGPSQVRTGTLGSTSFVVLDGFNHRAHSYLFQRYCEWLDEHSWQSIIGKRVLIILTRASSIYPTTNNVAEEMRPHIGALSTRDDSVLEAISPDLASSDQEITADRTRLFRHYFSVLLESLQQVSKQDASTFLRERLGEAV
jgi:hypothetical protein